MHPTINRSIVLIKGKQAFYDWSNEIFPGLPPIEMSSINECNSYLLEDELLFHDPKVALKKYWKSIFESELMGMCTDPAKWPKITWDLFTEWFDFNFSSMVHDLIDDDLYTEHYE